MRIFSLKNLSLSAYSAEELAEYFLESWLRGNIAVAKKCITSKSAIAKEDLLVSPLWVTKPDITLLNHIVIEDKLVNVYFKIQNPRSIQDANLVWIVTVKKEKQGNDIERWVITRIQCGELIAHASIPSEQDIAKLEEFDFTASVYKELKN